ncbi:uncharacterized protein Dsimw501_GD29538 [Drosophila simulans]|nr:uncharacterized protein Dsimw501_GD29538 [Drosophila simulans]
MFVLTIKHILKIKREINNLAKRQDRTTTCLTVDFQQYISFMRIFSIMGLSWILFFVTLLQWSTNFWNFLVILIRSFHCGFGIIIFLMLIFKRSTYRLLMNKIRRENS